VRIALEEAWRAITSSVRIIVYLVWLASLEAVARLIGAYDYYVRHRTHVVWDMAWTTKKVELADKALDPKGGML
jgi:hypothetical protein